jgi:AraC-like DNA-binding protein
VVYLAAEPGHDDARPARLATLHVRTSSTMMARMTAVREVPRELLPHLRRARDWIDRHYAEPLDLAELATVAGVSKYHFIRSFATAYGDTPMRYLTRRRIERACDLFRAANLTVTEICMLVGFASVGSFSSRFRALVGETPTEYRDRWAAAGGPRVPGCYLFMRGAMHPAGTALSTVVPPPS